MKTTMLALVALAVALPAQAQADEVAITVYNSDLALVKDVRTVRLDEGVHELQFKDVAERIDPTSVHFKVLDGPEAEVWEQNYRFDLASTSKILSKYLERDIDVITEDADLFSGTLVSFDGGGLVLDQGRGSGPIVSLNREKITHIRFPALPGGLISKPTLVWKIGARSEGDRVVEVTYMTSSINWHAEYVGVADADDENVDMSAWVSIDNRSGAAYEDAQLDLVAGDVHREQQRVDMMRMAKGAVEEMEYAPAPEFVEESLFEYHLYKLDTPATLADQEIKQLTFFPSTNVAVEKVFEFDGWRGSDVRVLLVFDNSDDAGLGLPLPAGKVRMYKKDSSGVLQFIGEDRIDHTPRDEEVELYLGNAFDVVGERTVLDRRKITDAVHEESYKVSVRNHKDEAVTVRVVEHPSRFWTVKDASHEFEKVDAGRIEFEVPVGVDEEAVLTYTIVYERQRR